MRPADMRKASIKGHSTPAAKLAKTVGIDLPAPGKAEPENTKSKGRTVVEPAAKKRAAASIENGSRSRMARSRMLGHD